MASKAPAVGAGAGVAASPKDNELTDRQTLEKTMNEMKLSDDIKKSMQAKLTEMEKAPAKKKMSLADFEDVAIIGRGAFAEVKVVRKKDDKKIYAMKIMSKKEMLRKKQVSPWYWESGRGPCLFKSVPFLLRAVREAYFCVRGLFNAPLLCGTKISCPNRSNTSAPSVTCWRSWTARGS